MQCTSEFEAIINCIVSTRCYEVVYQRTYNDHLCSVARGVLRSGKQQLQIVSLQSDFQITNYQVTNCHVRNCQKFTLLVIFNVRMARRDILKRTIRR